MITREELLEQVTQLRARASALRQRAEAEASALEAKAEKMEVVLSQFGTREERLLNAWLDLVGR
jgi:hypothetical protein